MAIGFMGHLGTSISIKRAGAELTVDISLVFTAAAASRLIGRQ